MTNQQFKQTLQQEQQVIQQWLRNKLESLAIADPRLAAAMQHGLMNGGKRLRPYLVKITATALSDANPIDNDLLISAAAAIEMIHSYSLVHDDLPAMDDDQLRRGQPTCHIAYDEATAILAGDALLTAAFEIISTSPGGTAEQKLQLIQILSQAAGAQGMVAGQAIDLANVDKAMALQALETMHRLKTGALIKAAILMGALVTRPSLTTSIREQLEQYADCIGLAFQVQDDILDVEGATEVLGKAQGADLALNKPTYPALLGLPEAKVLATSLIADAHVALNNIHQLAGITDASTLQPLVALTNYIVDRDY